MNLTELDNIKEVKTEDLVRMGMSIRESIAEMDSAKNVINAEISDRFAAEPAKYGDGIIVDEITAKVQKRTTWKTTLAQARDLGAIKEAIDTAKLTALDKGGATVAGKNVITYVVIERIDNAK